MTMTRRNFIATSALGALSLYAEPDAILAPRGIRTRFLGTGAAGGGYPKRQSSVLFEDKTIIDFTASVKAMIPKGVSPDAVFYTHSHGDHYNPVDALKIGSIRRVFTHESWAAGTRREFNAAAKKLGVNAPKVTPLAFGKPVSVNGLTITAVPANHVTRRVTDGIPERAAMYLIEKGPARVLYATDTAGIPAEAAQMIEIESGVRNGRPITGLIMEATTGFGCEDDVRLFTHSTVDSVARTVRVLTRTKRLRLPPGQSVYLTHRSTIGFNRDNDKNDALLPAPLKCARDGMELTLG